MRLREISTGATFFLKIFVNETGTETTTKHVTAEVTECTEKNPGCLSVLRSAVHGVKVNRSDNGDGWSIASSFAATTEIFRSSRYKARCLGDRYTTGPNLRSAQACPWKIVFLQGAMLASRSNSTPLLIPNISARMHRHPCFAHTRSSNRVRPVRCRNANPRQAKVL